MEDGDLLNKASQCRRLAQSTTDPDTARVLIEMATEYEARALIRESTSGEQGSDARPSKRGGHMAKHKAKVLLVDDEELILEQLVAAFEDAGFDVATATNAIDAHTVLEEVGTIDLVVTDVRMPGNIDGLMFGQVVHQRHPEVPIIVMSGVYEPDDRDVPAGATFIAKPFKAPLLIDEAKLLLGQRN
jgi:two-component system, response regulator PdtaR